MSITAEAGFIAHPRLLTGNDAELGGKGKVSQWHHGTYVVSQGSGEEDAKEM